MVEAYWKIGRRIVKEEQGGKGRAKYGAYLIKELSRNLGEEFGRGFSVANLKNFRQFYMAFPDFEKRYPLGSELSVPGKGETKDGLFLIGFHPNLSWSHYRALMRVDKKEAREFYETEEEWQNVTVTFS